jgi:hypothetical protein
VERDLKDVEGDIEQRERYSIAGRPRQSDQFSSKPGAL